MGPFILKITLREYVFQEERERKRIVCIEDSVETSIQRLIDFIEMCGRRLVTATRSNIDDTRIIGTEINQKNGKKNNSRDVLSD